MVNSNYFDITYNCPEIKPFNQYKKIAVVESFFKWSRNHLQSVIFDFVKNNIKEISLFNSTTDYIEFYALYWFGIIRPRDISESSLYDTGKRYDNDVIYDLFAIAGKIDRVFYKRLLLFIFNQTYDRWNIETLYRMAKEICNIEYSDITVDLIEINKINIKVPVSNDSSIFKTMIEVYRNIFKFPIEWEINIAEV